MRRRIVNFHQDDAGDWFAELECGHGYHIRHQPPWQDRAWVLTGIGRAQHLGWEVECLKCEVVQPMPSARGQNEPPHV